MNNITVQLWGTCQYGDKEGVFIGNPKFPVLNRKIDELADRYHVGPNAIVFAWLLRHPAHMQPLSGTTKDYRMIDICKGADIELKMCIRDRMLH